MSWTSRQEIDADAAREAEEAQERDCIACGEGDPENECAESKAPCGHHCNHSWTHDSCCWCGAIFGEDS